MNDLRVKFAMLYSFLLCTLMLAPVWYFAFNWFELGAFIGFPLLMSAFLMRTDFVFGKVEYLRQSTIAKWAFLVISLAINAGILYRVWNMAPGRLSRMF